MKYMSAKATAIRAEGAPVTMTCRICGNAITLQPGETLTADDGRICEHIAYTTRTYETS